MRGSFFSRLSPQLYLLLLMSLRRVWTQEHVGTAPSTFPVAPECPEACWCSLGGKANCSGLALPAVPDGLSWRVRSLLLDHNRVSALPPGAFADVGALLYLDLRENGLRSVHARAFWGLGVLQWLDLSTNQLETLSPGTFAPLRALSFLSLASNRLALLEPSILGPLPLLRVLSLQDNSLSALEAGLLNSLPALEVLRLRGNPWACSCALRPLCTWLHKHPRPASETETLLCVSPRRQTLSLLTAFPDAAFRHCAQSLSARDLAVVYALGPVSFLASLGICLALGSVLTACGARRRHRHRTKVRLLLRRQPDPEGPASLETTGSPAAAPTQA
ncbi:leucine-rich repeat-containing protein 26 [Meriones unguiculatus]|uniref:leucine-rich repeat-containing protein 26 n=1 Tax=Meriones unguiculatus TaxID=10047 RepID=UPI000B4EACB9|nr:leucine-rich repeat-containing protein 26 [Meriones unguiculatus]